MQNQVCNPSSMIPADIPLGPTVRHRGPVEQTFQLHWLNNKELQFTMESEKILQVPWDTLSSCMKYLNTSIVCLALMVNKFMPHIFLIGNPCLIPGFYYFWCSTYFYDVKCLFFLMF